MLSIIKRIVPVSVKHKLKVKLYDLVPPPDGNRSYSQAGEDRILSYLFYQMGLTLPTYLDIGANLPRENNNTYLFYEKGLSGVCVEADPSLFGDLLRARKRDKVLNIGITFDERREADFYIFSVPGLNTLSKEEAEFREKNGSHKIEKVIKIPLKTINEVIEENFDKPPDLISIDIEGLDLDVLKSLDFEKYRPTAICVETITYSENRTERKMTEILDFLISKGYFVYGDTHINTIFADEERFKGQTG
jgi:FkbM family methyltransferase